MSEKNTSASQAPAAGWTTTANGYEVTASREIILQILKKLHHDRYTVTVLYKGYQSGNTVIVDFSDQQLLIDKPVDWPGKSKNIRVLFKDSAKLWNHFNTRIIKETKDTLYTSFPKELYQLQRRNHFRVSAPQGTSAGFTCNDKEYLDFTVVDISAGGMKISTQQEIKFPKDASISKITINLPPMPDLDIPRLTSRQGRIVRGILDKESRTIFYAVAFYPRPPEEDLINKFVRQQELESLRKGFAL